MPTQVQAQSWYLSQCANIRLTEVPNSELRQIDGGGDSPGRDSGGYQRNPPAQQHEGRHGGGRGREPPREARLEFGVLDVNLTAEALRVTGQRPRRAAFHPHIFK